MYLLLGMMVFFVVAITITFRLEKRPVWPFGELQTQPDPQWIDAGGYARGWVAEAQTAGFSLLGWASHSPAKLFRVMYGLLVSPDRSTLAVIGSGTVGKLAIQCTWLHSPTTDGRSFFTTDKQAGVQIDLSKNWTNQLVLAKSFGQLWQDHRSWLQAKGVPPRNFPAGRELQQLRTAREEHFRYMEQAGLIAYCDPMAQQFQFTMSGAFRTATWSYLLGLMRGVTKGSFPKEA